MNFQKEKFAKILKDISYSYGSINKMANETGVTASYISKLIRLLYDSPPSPEILKKIADNSNNITNYDTLMYICGYLDNSKPSKLDNPKSNNVFESFNLQYIKLDNAGQKKVDDYIQDLINTNKYNKKK